MLYIRRARIYMYMRMVYLDRSLILIISHHCLCNMQFMFIITLQFAPQLFSLNNSQFHLLLRTAQEIRSRRSRLHKTLFSHHLLYL